MSAVQIDYSETRRLASQMIVTGEKILSLLEIQRPLPGMKSGLDSRLKLTVIRSMVAAHYGFSADMLMKQDRRASLAWARMVAMFLCRELTNCSGSEIEREFKRTHNTLHNSLKQVYTRSSSNTPDGRRCASDLLELRNKINEASA